MKKKLTSLTVSLLLAAVACASASPATDREEKAKPLSAPVQAASSANAPGKTVFDASHSEIFSPVKEGPLNYTGFYKAIKKSGEEVSLNEGQINTDALARATTYVIAGPAQPIARGEIAALTDFVNNGGNLLVLLHISGPVAPLTEEFGIIVSNFVISEKSGNIKKQSQDFYVSAIAPHPVTAGVKRLAVFGTWGLLAEGSAKVVASTSDKAWADMNRDRKLGKDEPQQAFGVVAVSEFGKGKVVVVADDAPFANKFIGEADNRKLADNIIRWFRE
ncbi:MAG: hypothetical protein HY955_07480 [Deltaproteobacteria bacterium]|nr:hypothetical protein [Deltaproteobacteria bacterium]